MIYYQENDITGIHYIDNDGTEREITSVYSGDILLWELIKGFVFTKDGYALETEDGFIIKAKDQ